jgi:hypothetical protein
LFNRQIQTQKMKQLQSLSNIIRENHIQKKKDSALVFHILHDCNYSCGKHQRHNGNQGKLVFMISFWFILISFSCSVDCPIINDDDE